MTDPSIPPTGWGAIAAAVTAAIGGVFWWLRAGRLDVTAAGTLQAALERLDEEIQDLRGQLTDTRQKLRESESRERKMIAYIADLRAIISQHGISVPPPLDLG